MGKGRHRGRGNLNYTDIPILGGGAEGKKLPVLVLFAPTPLPQAYSWFPQCWNKIVGTLTLNEGSFK